MLLTTFAFVGVVVAPFLREPPHSSLILSFVVGGKILFSRPDAFHAGVKFDGSVGLEILFDDVAVVIDNLVEELMPLRGSGVPFSFLLEFTGTDKEVVDVRGRRVRLCQLEGLESRSIMINDGSARGG